MGTFTKDDINALENNIRRGASQLAGGQKDDRTTMKALTLSIKSLIFKQYAIEQYSDLESRELKNVIAFVDWLSALDISRDINDVKK